MSEFKNTGVACLITVRDENRQDMFRHVDLGSLYVDGMGRKCAILSAGDASKYGHIVRKQLKIPVYVKNAKAISNDQLEADAEASRYNGNGVECPRGV